MLSRIKLLVISLIGVAVFLSVFLAFPVSADDVVDQITINVPVSCTLSGTNLTHTASMTGGQYKTDIGSANIKAVCNDTNGLAVYAIGYSNDTFGNNKMISSTVDHTYDIPTGKYTSGATNSSWSIKLTPVSGTYAPTIRNDAEYNYTDFEVIPSTYTKVAYRTSATDTGAGAIGANFTTTYGIYVSTTQPADSYTGKVRFTLVHPQDEEPLQPVACVAGKICYQPDANDVTGQMGNQTPTSSQITNGVPLWAPNFKRDGYGFAGWNTEFDYSGTTYGPMETITAPSDVSTKGLSLYAVWVKSAGTLQNWSGCSSLAEGAVTALTDERDGDTYAVAKLADGKCWMIENLRLADKDSNNNDINLSSSNTHDPLLPLNNSWYYKSQQGTLTTSNHLSATSDPTSTNPKTAWCDSSSSDCIDQSMLATNNTTLFTNNTASSYSVFSNVYSYGNYYNWYSATAGNGKYSTGGTTASGDICPAGWHLPTGKAVTGEFALLDIALGGTGANSSPSTTPTGTDMSKVWRSYPNNFVYSGNVNGSSVNNRGSNGDYWSASRYNDNSAYGLYFNSDYFIPGRNGYFKFFGRMVRCLVGG